MAAPILCHTGMRVGSTFTCRLIRSLSHRKTRATLPIPEKLRKFKQPFAQCFLLSVAGLNVDAATPDKKTERSFSNITHGDSQFTTASSSDSSLTFEPNDPRLRGSECLKNAARLAVDSTSAVLSQTVYEIARIEDEYVKLINVLILLMEYQLQVLGHSAEEQRMADLILETRHEISEVRRRKQDLELLFASVTKLADATAEVSFATSANYASTSAGERLESATREVQRILHSSEDAEKRLQLTEVKSIEVLTKHEDKLKKQQEAEEERKQEEEESKKKETGKLEQESEKKDENTEQRLHDENDEVGR